METAGASLALRKTAGETLLYCANAAPRCGERRKRSAGLVAASNQHHISASPVSCSLNIICPGISRHVCYRQRRHRRRRLRRTRRAGGTFLPPTGKRKRLQVCRMTISGGDVISAAGRWHGREEIHFVRRHRAHLDRRRVKNWRWLREAAAGVNCRAGGAGRTQPLIISIRMVLCGIGCHQLCRALVISAASPCLCQTNSSVRRRPATCGGSMLFAASGWREGERKNAPGVEGRKKRGIAYINCGVLQVTE